MMLLTFFLFLCLALLIKVLLIKNACNQRIHLTIMTNEFIKVSTLLKRFKDNCFIIADKVDVEICQKD